MAAGAYLIRGTGLFLARRLAPGPFLEAFLGDLLGAMSTALIVPSAVAGGSPYIVAALATLLSARSRAPLVVCDSIGILSRLTLRAVLER